MIIKVGMAECSTRVSECSQEILMCRSRKAGDVDIKIV